MSKRLLVLFLLLLASPGLADTPSGLGNAQREIPLSTGVTLEYEQQGIEAGQPVIFLHGYIDSWYSFARVKPLLPKEIRAYFLSLRGHGDSGKNDCCYQQADFAADVRAFMDAKNIPQATIVGHSMGSFVAQKLAIENPERVAGLVLLGSAPVAGNEVLVELDQLVQGLTEIDRGFVEFFQGSTLCQPLPQDFFDQLVEESLKVPLHVWKRALAGLVAENNSARLGEIKSPALVAGGMKDSIFGTAEQLALAKAIPQADVVLYSNQCHAPHWEEPKKFTEDLMQFLRKRVGQS